ncbi:unnamed protein product, partial [Gulo gulo]
ARAPQLITPAPELALYRARPARSDHCLLPRSSGALNKPEQSAEKHNGARPSPGSGAEPAATVESPSLLLPRPQLHRLRRLLARGAVLWGPESCGRARRTLPRGGALTAATVEGLPRGGSEAPLVP